MKENTEGTHDYPTDTPRRVEEIIERTPVTQQEFRGLRDRWDNHTREELAAVRDELKTLSQPPTEKPRIPYLKLGWTEEQTQAFADLKQALPDVARQVVKARDTLFSAGKHPPHEVLKSRNILNTWLMMPSVFEVNHERKP